MVRIFLLLMTILCLANITVAFLKNRTKNSTEVIFRKPTKLHVFIQKLENECDFDLLDAVQKDLKDLWTKAMKEENERPLREMNDLKMFFKKLIDGYNKCSEKKLHIDDEGEWEIYMKIFGKEYPGWEKEKRKVIFKKNKENVKKHNELYKKGLVSYSVNLNHFSDWTEEELKNTNGILPPSKLHVAHPKRITRQIGVYYSYIPNSSMPLSFDWRPKGYINPVKQQGNCGSCYAMAGLGALEAYHKREKEELVRLSVQNILDCTWYLGNRGCEGGTTFSVFQYAQTTGIVANYHYPYTTNASLDCKWKFEHVVATDKGYYVVASENELALMSAVVNYGPVAVSIATNSLRGYRSGIFESIRCGPANHGVLVVGYGTDPEQGDYWIVKNSWGFWWGEDGYVRIARNKHNMCKIATYAYFPY